MFGDNVRILRKQRGWSQAELARRLNRSPSTVTMIEQNERLPSLPLALDIARILETTTEALAHTAQPEQVQS